MLQEDRLRLGLDQMEEEETRMIHRQEMAREIEIQMIRPDEVLLARLQVLVVLQGVPQVVIEEMIPHHQIRLIQILQTDWIGEG